MCAGEYSFCVVIPDTTWKHELTRINTPTLTLHLVFLLLQCGVMVCKLICPVMHCSLVHHPPVSEGDKDQMFKQQSCLSSFTCLPAPIQRAVYVFCKAIRAPAFPFPHSRIGECGQLTRFDNKIHNILFLSLLFIISYFFSLFLFFISLFSITAGCSIVSPSLSQESTQHDSVPPSFLPCGKNLSSTPIFLFLENTNT